MNRTQGRDRFITSSWMSLTNVYNQNQEAVGAAIHCAQRWGWKGKRPHSASRGNVDPFPPIFGRNELLPLPRERTVFECQCSSRGEQ